jgi:hypothetical protein
MIQSFRIATPCSARWSLMRGDDRVRFCGQCQKNVYDFSQLTLGEIESLLRRTEGKVCARLWRLPGGQFLTADCPVGKRRKRVRLLGSLATAFSLFVGYVGGVFWGRTSGVMMGALAATPEELSHVRNTALETKNLANFGQNNAP